MHTLSQSQILTKKFGPFRWRFRRPRGLKQWLRLRTCTWLRIINIFLLNLAQMGLCKFHLFWTRTLFLQNSENTV